MAWWMAVLAAPFAGSFVGVLIRRLPRDRPGLWGRSACEACGHTLGVSEMVPVASFLAQRGRCRACGAPIAPSHLAVELAALAIAAIAAATGAAGWELWEGCALGWTLLALAWIDLEQFWLPDVLTLPLLVAGLLVAWAREPWTLTDRAAGAIAGYLAFRVIGRLYAALRGREGLGQGDAKLLAAAGAWLGWPALPTLVLVAALVAIAMAVAGRRRGAALTGATALPFGPALAAAFWTLWLVRAWRG
jgi:leader peptidase (prepilin peptidase)/N-methyltransferase